jgi:PAS domain S-box-containing protein
MLGSITDITERKAVAKTTEEDRANLARAEEMVRLGHYKYDVKSATIIWSQGAYRIFGKSPETFTPTFDAVRELFDPEDRPLFDKTRIDVLQGRESPPVTLRAIDDARQIIYIRNWAMPTYAADGTISGYFGTAQDVTERHRADAALKESRDNLARAEEIALLGHTWTDRNTGAYTWSGGVYRIMRKSPDTFTPTPENTLAIIHPEDRTMHEQYRRDVMAGIDVNRKTLRAVLDDGETIFVEFWSVPIRDKDGAITGKFSTLQDVTALRRNEALLSESNANLERAERLALLGHYKIDRGSGELIWSDGVYRIFGLSPEAFTPTLRSALELIHPDDRPLLKKFRDEAMAGHEVPHATLRAFRADGSEMEFEYWSTPVRANGGSEITGVFGTVQDVTLRKRVEMALARANVELEKRVHARTAELAEEMQRREQAQTTLAQMQKMEVVGQLTAGIAHDFNNLLAVIGGSLEFVDGAAARGLTADPELIDAALRATRRGRELVQRLLAFARQSPLRSEATAIDQLVLDTLRLLRRTLGQGIDMVTHLDAKAAVISVDRNQMANALLNLALNARDAMPEGGQLTIATRVQKITGGDGVNGPPTGEEVVITISDTGVGMTEEVRSRAFEPFFTTKPDGLGSGLGLSMVQGFVEQSGGHIEIRSEENGGTTFIIKLPRIALASRQDEADAVTGLTVQGREKTVLLVEDDPDVRIVTAAQIKKLGYRVHAVTDGMEAIDLIASPATIDITLTDIVLPGGLDGVELIKEAMRARPKMGVLCMSGYDPTQKHRKWLQIQNINFLEKPFSSSRLAQALNDALVE